MKDNYIHICIVLDASGSMSGAEEASKKSFNEFIKARREDKDNVSTLDFYQFSDEVEKIVDFKELGKADDDFMKNYHCDGCTALNDAICTAIDEVGAKLSSMPEEERPFKVMFAILTDGMENASRKFSGQDVRDRIKTQKDTYKWEFIYLAANQDSFEVGRSYGFDENRCLDIDVADMKFNTKLLNSAVMCCYDRLDFSTAELAKKLKKTRKK